MSPVQVFDLPEPQPLIVTEHRAHGCRCAACGTQTRALVVSRGRRRADARTASGSTPVVLYLLRWTTSCTCPKKRSCPTRRWHTSSVCIWSPRPLPGSARTVPSGLRRCFADHPCAITYLVQAASVKHMDETGFRIGGKTQWLAHRLLRRFLVLAAFYRVSSGGVSAASACYGRMSSPSGTVVHDQFDGALLYHAGRAARAVQRPSSACRWNWKALVEIEIWKTGRAR